MKDLIKVFAKDILNEKFDAAESLVYCGVAFVTMLSLLLLAGVPERITQ